jgi:hypothetical protein
LLDRELAPNLWIVSPGLKEPVGIRAAMAMWMFFNRPLDGGVRWSQILDFADAAQFVRWLSGEPTRLIEMCREVAELQGVTRFESRAMLAAIEAHDNLRLDMAEAVDRVGPSDSPAQPTCGEDARKHRRLNEGRRISVRVDKIQYRASLRDISNGGAMVSGLWGLQSGHSVFLELDARQWIGGTVRWAIDDRCGIELERSPDPRDAHPTNPSD